MSSQLVKVCAIIEPMLSGKYFEPLYMGISIEMFASELVEGI